MTSEPILKFDNSQRLGVVASVDTSRVHIVVENAELLPRASVGSLIAVQGLTAQEFLIGMTERVTRQLSERMSSIDSLEPTEVRMEMVPDDAVRVVILGTYRTVDGLKRDVFRRGADSFPQIDRACFLIDGTNLQGFMSLLGKELAELQRLELGHFAIDSSAIAVANGDRFFQRHAAVLGSTGSGKSYAVSLILERAHARKFANIVVFDMHGEYASLAAPEERTDGTKPAPIATYYRIAGPGDLKEPTSNVIFLPYWLLNREEMLSMILDRSDQNAPNQASRFTMHVKDLKAKTLATENKEDVAATFTVDSPIPYALDELMGLLEKDNTEKGVGKNGAPVKGEWEDRLTRFISRLRAKADDRRYGFLFQPPPSTLAYGWMQEQVVRLLSTDGPAGGIKIVDFSEVPSDVLPVVTGVFARLLYDVQFWMEREKRSPFVFVCDEAHLYLPAREDSDSVERQALHAFERIAKEGRKYGVSLLVVSQRPSDVSKTILSQCNNFLVLRLTNDQDQGVVRRLMPDSLAGVLESVPLLDTGEALLLGDAILLPARIRLRFPSIEPLSQTRNFWQEWGERPADAPAIRAAVETLRRQTRS